MDGPGGEARTNEPAKGVGLKLRSRDLSVGGANIRGWGL